MAHTGALSHYIRTYKAKADANVSCVEKNPVNNQRSYVKQELYPHTVAERLNIRRRTLSQKLSLKFTGVGPRVQLSR